MGDSKEQEVVQDGKGGGDQPYKEDNEKCLPPDGIELSLPPRSIREQSKDDGITKSEGYQPVRSKEVECKHAQLPYLHEAEPEPYECGKKVEEVCHGNEGRNP